MRKKWEDGALGYAPSFIAVYLEDPTRIVGVQLMKAESFQQAFLSSMQEVQKSLIKTMAFQWIQKHLPLNEVRCDTLPALW